ncbi:MAG TPA: TAT-variant-translocated molybdopterin oxidoreductase [Chitinophagaceae bacterium]|jgi:molybdopterin-containing oxidoreductase family iron-sulfur binding subunit|nr:TAT-variant-translocated molybdopterin oxidoreductase [Chitinophagaceae bacterium]
MSEKKYWQSFGELKDQENFQKKQQDEFREELPFEDMDGKGWLDAKSPRRDFLKYLGFSTAAATLAASCEIPVRKVVPYANKPENMVPGVAKYYATTYVQDGDVVPVVAKVRDGRPIKIEGNSISSITRGGTSARAQASVLDLYDMYRIKFPSRKVAEGKFEEVPTFEQFDKMVGDALAGLNGSPVVLLTSTVVSPTTKQIITDFLAKYPGSRHVQYDGVSYSAMLQANEATFGKKAIPSYNFSNAKVIVSLGADFLATWLSPVEFARQYATGRKIDEKNPEMNKHYQFEGNLSTTGASADERFTHRPSETGAVALALLAALGGNVAAPTLADDKLKKGIAKVAADLKANNGKALVVSGSNDVNVQIIVNAINNAIGAYGSTIDWSATANYRQGVDKDFTDLLAQMSAGQVGALFVYGANPVYDYYDADKVKAALAKVKLTVSFSEKMDETTQLCSYIIPNHHYLESWGDAEPKTGYLSFLQPTIYPLFKTRPFQTSLLKWSGNNTDYEVYFKNYWTGKFGSEEAFDKALQDGVLEPASVTASAGSFNGSAVATAATAISSAKKGGKKELVLYQKVSLGTGRQAGNPWLQELPDPISKATWDNYALISMTTAKELGIVLDNDYEYYPDKPVVKITAGNKSVELPILVMPGMNADTIAVAVGYGRSEKLGKAAEGVGQNVYQFASFNGTTVDGFNGDVTIEKTGKTQKIAQTQIHNSYEHRTEVVKETTLATLKKYPHQYEEFREELAKDFAPKTGDYRVEGTLYPDHLQPGIKWGMSVDMNSCIACNACIISCHAENNVPVVGKSEVLRFHDMHWLRLDRYFVSDDKDPDNLHAVVFQPMMCQHCDNAPCENVCPVAATNHSSEGLNQMTYNRCIGTRYCANNCPYKVRRFNWADYTGADSFPNNQDQKVVGQLSEVVTVQMMDDLTRMVLNPDVTVRSRGVIEKCSFCVQRLQEAKLNAKKEDRPLADGEAKTACMTACPTDAIVFGNVHDKSSRVSKLREDNPNRLFYVIEQLHTLPNVSYLAKVRNTDEVIAPEETMEEGGESGRPAAEKAEPVTH